MPDTVATVAVALLGLHIVAKFAFFALPSRRRRALLDKHYGATASATDPSGPVLVAALVL